MLLKKQQLNPTKMIAVGYCIIILTGALLLCLPISSRGGNFTPFVDALFTATSATCVTGLVLYDTYTYWSTFGQLILLILIQMGGIGFMTIAISAISLTKRKIGLKDRFVMKESVAAPQVGGIVRLTKFITFGTAFFEGLGAIALSFTLIPKLGVIKGIYFSVFHSISAFCNAGIDLMGAFSPGTSLITLSHNYMFITVIMLLIVIGGLGFFVWSDLVEKRFKYRYYCLHTKLVLSSTIILIVFGTLGIFMFESTGQAFIGKPGSEKFMISLFQAVTPRTAGFNTIDLNLLTDSSQLLIICLMFIGGSPGSTAGGIKTTTFAILVLSIVTVIKRKKSVDCFNRRIDDETLRQVCCILMMYLILIVTATMVIGAIDHIPMKYAMFETTSAMGTVGLSLGITAQMGTISRLIVTALMYLGRVGGITVLLAVANRLPQPAQLPIGKIAVG
ncbi:MAG TPA: Trk family potassium uptake protein [Lachnospiraceae bacterium]|nr:Trk family potassium uptake protein [Lachnospiraceae bacterium]